MARQKCIPLDSPAEWKEALVGIGHAFSHTWENCYAMHLTTGFRTYLYCFDAEHVRAAHHVEALHPHIALRVDERLDRARFARHQSRRAEARA